MYHRHSPKGWDRWSRVMSNSVGFLRKDATYVPEVRSPTVRRRELGALLRALRTAKGLTVEQAAERLMISMSKLSRMETGHGVATPRDVRDLCDLYGVTDQAERDRMTQLAREGKQQAWWQSYELSYETYVGLEAEAVVISAFQSSAVHGLLQTAVYARAGHEGAMPRLSPDQIEVQVLPFDRGAHPALESNFTILELPHQAPDVVFVEGLIGSTYLDRADDLKRYHEIFRKLQSIALNPQDTADLIVKRIRDYGDGPGIALSGELLRISAYRRLCKELRELPVHIIL